MAFFRIDRDAPLTVEEAWHRVTDWPAHGAGVPLTRVRVVTAGPTRVGSRFTARTGLGRLGFDDPMEVVRWEPPAPGEGPGRAAGLCRMEKRGRMIIGWAEITVRETPAGTRVGWTEELRVRGLPRFCDGLLARAGRSVFGHTLAGLLAGGPSRGADG
ncbi:SRPBCC family protein [Streptomyces sp. NPDC050856]|uniref:SRPBCC family protein n=1 Tax=Streptomyces sp. NPDC050856 TaxID=3154939 RepID=UPI0033E159AE